MVHASYMEFEGAPLKGAVDQKSPCSGSMLVVRGVKHGPNSLFTGITGGLYRVRL